MAELLLEITDEMVNKIFRDYNAASYGHLLVMMIKEDESMENKRQALGWWLEVFAKGDGKDDERQDAVLAAVKHRPGALDELIWSLREDQYFQEPLYHMLNQHCKDPDLHMFKTAQNFCKLVPDS